MTLPTDTNGFIQSFIWNDTNGISSFLDKYGVVVISDVLSQNEINLTIDAIWQHDELTSRGVNKYDPSTWERCWPRDGSIEKRGWISSYDDTICPVSWYNRFNPKITSVFENIWKYTRGTYQDLRVKTDRYGVMRPILNKEWKTLEGWLHTDLNPVREKNIVRYQGILTLSESNINTGGFVCIPKFHKVWKDYCKINKNDQDVCLYLTKSDPKEEKIFARAGSLIIWDSRLPHANYPNNSKQYFRYVQYITYYPTDHESNKKKRNRKEDAVHIYNKLKQRGYTLSEKELKYIGAY